MVKYIPLSNGKHAIVDDDMYDFLSQWEWKVDKEGYAYRTGQKEDGVLFGRRLFIHRVTNGTPDGFVTDHIDRNKLNNLRSNLRTCTTSENCANVPPFENKASKYKGVSLSSRNRWRVRVSGVGHIGYFKCEKAAAEAYNQKAKEFYGDFAYLNDITDHDDCDVCAKVKKRKYLGVYKVQNKFRVIVKVDNKNIHVGYFGTEDEAAKAYNIKAVELLGDKAKLNEIRNNTA